MKGRKGRTSPTWTGVMPLLIVALTGCGGVIETGKLEVATLYLVADAFQALQMENCIQKNGETACAKYPNPLVCANMNVIVRRDGSTRAQCLTELGDNKTLKNASDGIPFVCKANPDSDCVSCIDVYGETVLKQCGLPSFLAGKIHPGLTTETKPEAVEVCTVSNAAQRYAEELNKVLADEGLCLTFQPDLNRLAQALEQLNNLGELDDFGEICRWFLEEKEEEEQEGEPASDFCQEDSWSGQTTVCRCGAMAIEAMAVVCREMVEVCEPGDWEMALMLLEGLSSSWLSDPTYDWWEEEFSEEEEEESPGEGEGDDDADTGGPTGKDPGTEGECDDDITCTGSPMVLDLKGNGLNLSSLDRGVRFNLLARGPVYTAWIQGDDALLAIDRNANGSIDSGRELFGEAFSLDGPRSRDGFQALSQVDDPRHGGNGNGQVEAGDRLFGQLRLWNDWNRDGISQQTELRNLAQAGIRSLGLTPELTQEWDQHGNHVGMQGQFMRTDDRPGFMIDAWFVFSKHLHNLISM